MSSVRKVSHRSGKTSWQARWRDPMEADRAKNFIRRVDADRFLVKVESDKLRGRFADPRLARTRLADWMEEWQATRTNQSPLTRIRDEGSIRNHVIPRFGLVPIGQLQPVHVGQWVADLDASGLAPATTRKAYQLLAAAMSSAVDNGLIPVSPCRNVNLPKLTSPAMRILDPAEIGALADAIDGRYRALVLTAAFTGLRYGELAALHVDRFDALRKSLRVEESLAEVRGEFVFKAPKSHASRRTVSLPSFLVEELAQHLAAYRDDSGIVFTAPEGGPMRHVNLRHRTWLPAVRQSVGEPCTFHSLRHSHAAILIAQGEHPKVIQERLGHTSIKTTLDTYGHLFDGMDEAAAERLDEAWRVSPVDAPWTQRGSEVRDITSG